MQQLQFWPNEQEVEVRERIWNQIDCENQNQLMERLAQVICKAIQHPPNNLEEQEEIYESE